jgi:hypothetical protein
VDGKPLITFFCIPKAFCGLTATIQTNAIRSWRQLNPDYEIILFGNDEGTAEIASELKIKHIRDVECTESGTPLVSSLFAIAQKEARYDFICYINADIILLSDFTQAVRYLTLSHFLCVGQRWDVEWKNLIDFDKTGWESELRERVKSEGNLHPASGIDYFIFLRGFYKDIPPFAVGRGAWDNWLVYDARAGKAPVIDATGAITAVHQNHDYSHVSGGATTVWKGKESERNIKYLGNLNHAFSIDYATLHLTSRGIKQTSMPRNIYFRLRAAVIIHPALGFFLVFFKAFEKLYAAARHK